MGWHQFVGTILLLYGLINPVGAVPIYSRLVRKSGAGRTHRILIVASLAVACLLITAALWGEPILAFFNVGLDDFRIAGGLLAFPLLVGPAEMSAMITLSNDTLRFGAKVCWLLPPR